MSESAQTNTGYTKKSKSLQLWPDTFLNVPVPALTAINKETWKRKNARTAVQLWIRRPYDK